MFTKIAGLLFWLTLGVLGLVSSGWFIYLVLDFFIRREVLGQNLGPADPETLPFFLGCVVIFILCAYGIRKAVSRAGVKDAAEVKSA